MVTAKEDSPPYVVFSYQPVENRQKSIDAGRPVFDDVAFATITPTGGKDSIIRNVDEWFAMLKKQVAVGRFPHDWLSAYERMFEAWKKGEEIPISGTPIKTWPAITPAIVKELLALNVYTVEALATLNEEGLGRLGMGGRSLKQLAVDYLEAAKDIGTVSKELETLRRDKSDLQRANDQLTARVKELEAQLKINTAPEKLPDEKPGK